HLSRLYDFCYPQASPLIKFVIVSLCAWFVGFSAMVVLVKAGATYVEAPVAAYFAAILTTAVFHLRYVRTQRKYLTTLHRWRMFILISATEWWVALGAACVAQACRL